MPGASQEFGFDWGVNNTKKLIISIVFNCLFLFSTQLQLKVDELNRSKANISGVCVHVPEDALDIPDSLNNGDKLKKCLLVNVMFGVFEKMNY